MGRLTKNLEGKPVEYPTIVMHSRIYLLHRKQKQARVTKAIRVKDKESKITNCIKDLKVFNFLYLIWKFLSHPILLIFSPK